MRQSSVFLLAGGTVLGSLAVLWQRSQESFEPDIDILMLSIMRRIRDKGVRLAPGGVTDVRLFESVLDPPEQDSMLGIIMGRLPTYSVTARIRVEFELRGGDVLRSHVITVRGRGETRGDALRDARQGIQSVLVRLRKIMQ